jgi:hypothetical protein
MNWDAIGAVGEILGAIAVFASLMYLARQIRASDATSRSQMEAELGKRGFQAYDPIYTGRNAEIFHQGLMHPEDLSEVDAFVFDLFMHRHFGAMAEFAIQIKSGIIPANGELARIAREHYRTVLINTPGGRTWLSSYSPADEVLSALGLSLTEDNRTAT